MTRTEERLADALDAAARALREDTLRPLRVPERSRPRLTLAAPLAAAAALLLVVGVGVSVARYLPGSGRQSSVPTSPPRYYVEASFINGDLPEVRSTATGAVTDTVRLPHAAQAPSTSIVAAASNGVFFVTAAQSAGERIYRFRLTANGRVTDLAPLPGGAFGDSRWAIGAMAASPDGTQLAVALTPTTSTSAASCSSSTQCSYPDSNQNDYIDVVSTATGARSVWQGGIPRNFAFVVVSLSWASNGNELVYLGQWCPQPSGNSGAGCPPGTRTDSASAQVWALSPPSRGGALTSGRRLFRTSAGFAVPQAVISPQGSTITAVVVTGPARASAAPTGLSVEQFSVPADKPLRVLYRQDLRHVAAARSSVYLTFVGLKADVTGRYFMLTDLVGCTTGCSGGVNGWIDNGRLVPLPPGGGSMASEAW